MDTSAIVGDILEHHGTKGMKWGVRSTKTTSSSSRSERRQAKRIAKYDAKFTKNVTNKRQNMQIKTMIHNDTLPVARARVHKINAKPEYAKEIAKGKDSKLNDRNDPITKKYLNDVNTAYLGVMNDYLGGYSNASGTQRLRASYKEGDYLNFKLTLENTSKVKHADPTEMIIEYIRDESGKVTGFKIVDDEMQQSSDVIENILEHYGTKGMRWGVRRKATVGAQEVIVSDKRKKIKTSGGQGHPAHPDAVKVRTIGQIGKKSGLKSLSDADLTAYNKRLNLEQNTKRLMYEDSSAPSKFIKTLIRQTGKQQANEAASSVASKQVKKALTRAALVAA